MGVPYVPWSSIYEIRVPRIDAQHRRLADLINEFHAAVSAGLGTEQTFSILSGLVRYAEEHFRDEEALMDSVRFPELVRHRREHEKLTVEHFSLEERLERSDSNVEEMVMSFLKAWLIDHILHEDKKIEAHRIWRS